jgi:serine/threonine protein kinase
VNDTLPDREPTLGKYRILESIGRGGFATVYKARHISLGSEVALKVMLRVLSEEESFVQRFQLEARQTARLDHPNIVRVLDLDEDQGQVFIAMEYVQGRDLRQMIKGQLLPLEQVVAIIRQVAEALDYAHSRDLVHRDVTPGNILVREDGAVKLADFGIVKAITNTKLTQTGATIGTPAYMSPEQTQGHTVTNQSDIYSLGVVAYEMLTGRVPFSGDTPVSVGVKHVNESPPPPSSISSRARAPVESVLLKALAKKPDDRYQTARSFAEALAEAIDHLQQTKLDDAYATVSDLIEKRQYSAALEELMALRELQPGNSRIEALIDKVQNYLQLASLQKEAEEHLNAAHDLTKRMIKTDPDFPGIQAVTQLLASRFQNVPKGRQQDKAPGSLGWNWIFIVGVAVIVTAYQSTTWKWIDQVVRTVDAAGQAVNRETVVSIGGYGIFLVARAPVVIWLMVVPVAVATAIFLFQWRRGNKLTPIVRALLVTLLALGVIGSVLMVFEFENLGSTIAILIGALLCLTAVMRNVWGSRLSSR